MNVLDKIEASSRSTLIDRAREDTTVSYRYAFGLPFVCTPFLITASMFIPLLGQLLALGAIVISIAYCRARRSWKHFFVGAFSVISSVIALTLLSSAFSKQLFFGGYILMGFSTAVSIAYIVGVSGALWHFYETGVNKKGRS